jgi:REP element-mobilizing transposase RayT
MMQELIRPRCDLANACEALERFDMQRLRLSLDASQPLPENRNGWFQFPYWQRRFWEHTVRDPDDFSRHADYVHFNPVKHGLVARAVDWPQADDDVGGFGEVDGEPA